MRTIVAAVVFVVTASPLLLAQWPKYHPARHAEGG